MIDAFLIFMAKIMTLGNKRNVFPFLLCEYEQNELSLSKTLKPLKYE